MAAGIQIVIVKKTFYHHSDKSKKRILFGYRIRSPYYREIERYAWKKPPETDIELFGKIFDPSIPWRRTEVEMLDFILNHRINCYINGHGYNWIEIELLAKACNVINPNDDAEIES